MLVNTLGSCFKAPVASHLSPAGEQTLSGGDCTGSQQLGPSSTAGLGRLNESGVL